MACATCATSRCPEATTRLKHGVRHMRVAGQEARDAYPVSSVRVEHAAWYDLHVYAHVWVRVVQVVDGACRCMMQAACGRQPVAGSRQHVAHRLGLATPELSAPQQPVCAQSAAMCAGMLRRVGCVCWHAEASGLRLAC